MKWKGRRQSKNIEDRRVPKNTRSLVGKKPVAKRKTKTTATSIVRNPGLGGATRRIQSPKRIGPNQTFKKTKRKK